MALALRALRELTQSGRNAEALATASAVLESAPFHRDALYWSVVNLRLLGRVSDATETLDRLDAVSPDYSLASQERGLCLVAIGNWPSARRAFERAVTLNPALIDSWESLERLLREAGDFEKASFATRQLERLRSLPAAIVEAGARFSDGDYASAETRLDEFLAGGDRHVEALRLLGRIAQRRGALARAEFLLGDVVSHSPAYAAARLDLVRILIERQKYATALETVDDGLRQTPSDFEAKFLRATILAGLARHEEAISTFRDLVEESPGRNELRIVLGHSLKALGRAEDAIRLYRQASESSKHVGDAYWSLANLKTYQFGDTEIERMREIEARSKPGLKDRAELCFAIGKALEDRAAYRDSWMYYQRGNALAREKRRYRADVSDDIAQRLIELFTPEFFAARAHAGVSSRQPIFVVGLPRSGSTLLEQILASHRDVDGTQELYDIPRIVDDLRAGTSRYPELLADLDFKHYEALGRRYLDDTLPYRRGRPRFLDKMPNNFWHIGLIHLMLPNAGIVDIRRHPMATCVSNYKQYYAKGQEFCYSVEDIARYYKSYLKLMNHWRVVLPGRVLTIAYEDLVEDLEASLQTILAHCGLEFDSNCLDFHHNQRAVNTPSSEQVRQPLYRDGLSSWRRFEPWLDPLRTALGDTLERWNEYAKVL